MLSYEIQLSKHINNKNIFTNKMFTHLHTPQIYESKKPVSW